MYYHKIEKHSIANGTGIRVVLWISGCSLKCRGCQNPQTWDFCSGKLFNDKAKEELFTALSNPYIQGITLSGGHPLEPQNINDVHHLLLEIKEKFPTKDVWLYTGYTYEELYYKEISRILLYIDVLVDGPYVQDKRDITLKYRGSKNQRLIDVKKTLEQGKVVTLDA